VAVRFALVVGLAVLLTSVGLASPATDGGKLAFVIEVPGQPDADLERLSDGRQAAMSFLTARKPLIKPSRPWAVKDSNLRPWD
jgi:hypothetical protein